MREKKGITLIALVITIIVLLILAGVSINIVLGESGVLTNSQEAVIENRGASVQEQRDLWHTEQEMYSYLGGDVRTLPEILDELEGQGLLDSAEIEFIKTNGYIEIGSRTGDKAIVFKEITLADKVESNIVKIGDYVAYEPTTGTSYTIDGTYSGTGANQIIAHDTTLKWRVLDVKDGQVRLISNLPTSYTVSLQGADGYNNSVKLLDELCSTLYSNAIGTAQSLKIEDIQDHMNETDYSKITSTYGTSISCSSTYYPVILEKENKQFGNSDTGNLSVSEQDNWYYGKRLEDVLTVTSTYWQVSNLAKKYFNNDEYYSMLITCSNKENFGSWLSSRGVSGSEGFVLRFHVYCTGNFSNNYAGSNSVFHLNINWKYSAWVRPCVKLQNNVCVQGTEGESGSEEDPWLLK